MPTTKDCIQLAFEESPRYEGAPTTTPYRVSTVNHYPVIQSGRIGPAPQGLDRSDEVRGIEGAVPDLVETYEPDGNLTIRAYFNSLVFLLHGCGLVGTYTAGAGGVTDPDGANVPAGAAKWVFTKRAGINAKTMEVIAAYVDEGVFLKGQGFALASLGLTAGGAVTAELAGLVLARIADPNIAPVFDAAALVPARRGDFTIQTWAAGTGASTDWTVNIANPVVRQRSMGLDPASNFPDRMEHADDKVRAQGTIPKSVLATADIDRLIDMGTFAVKTRWKTPKAIGATAAKYSCWFEAPACQYIGGNPDDIANRRRFGANYDWRAAWDESAGYDFRITILNSITALETYI